MRYNHVSDSLLILSRRAYEVGIQVTELCYRKIPLTKVTTAQIEAALSHIVRGLYFRADVFAATIVVLEMCGSRKCVVPVNAPSTVNN